PDRQTRSPQCGHIKAGLDVDEAAPSTTLATNSDIGFVTNSRCTTATITALARGNASHDSSTIPYSCRASSALGTGSWTCTSTPYACNSWTTSITRVLRMSGQSSLKVNPRTLTFEPLICEPLRIMCLTVCSAMNLPMPSLIRRPARITCGW